MSSHWSHLSSHGHGRQRGERGIGNGPITPRLAQATGERRKGYIGFGRLRDWSDLRHNPPELLTWMTSNIPELMDFLNMPHINYELLELFMGSLQSVIELKSNYAKNFEKLLEVLASSDFYSVHALNYVTQYSPQRHLNTLLTLVLEICQRMPGKCSKCYKFLKYISTHLALTPIDSKVFALAVKAFNGSATEKLKQEKRRLRKWRDIDDPPDDICDLSIFPAKEDLDTSIAPFLRANKTRGDYRDKLHYLDVIFRLMREDFIEPLRDSLKTFNAHNGSIEGNYSAVFYRNVHIVGLEIFDGINHILKLDMSNLQHVKWNTDRRLIFGSLICLSHDEFNTIIYATVTQMDREQLRKGILTVKFQNCLDDVYCFSHEDALVMTENPSFFEAYRHVLEGLQDKTTSHLPMEKYLVQCDRAVSPPSYLSSLCRYDVSCLMKHPGQFNNYVSILTPTSWPDMQSTCLNDQQLKAVVMGVTKEIALLQGPPGTGKTFVGLKILKLLLENANARSRSHAVENRNPILVVCYTNHALDQFLEGILNFCEDGIVRVGGRNKNPALLKFGLNELRQKHKDSMSTRNNIRDCHREMDDAGKRIEQLWYKMQESQLEIQSEHTMKDYMSKSQFKSLAAKAIADTNRMKQWLHAPQQNIERHLMNAVESFLVGLILKETDEMGDSIIFLQEPISITTKAKIYRGWVSKAGRRHSVVHGILHDNSLEPYIQRNILQVLRRQGYSTIKEWLLGGTLDSMLAAAEELQGGLTKISSFGNLEEYTHVRDQRIFDDDSDEDELIRSHSSHVNRRRSRPSNTTGGFPQLLKRAKHVGISLTQQDTEWQTAHSRLSFGEVIRRLQKAAPMTETEASGITDVWGLSLQDRFKLYKFWLTQHLQKLNDEVRFEVERYEEILAQKKEIREMQNVAILQNAKVIGMTTTGAAKHRRVLEAVGPQVVVVEEAAEVLEAHIVTALSSKCEHLILIGDHQQLRPKTEVYQLAKKFHLDVSLFERLVNNSLPCVKLNKQHRMRPEIAMFMRHIYPDLRDSQSVQGRENVAGMRNNVFFVQHEYPETTAQNSKSKINTYEADYLLKLCVYLNSHGYLPEDVTVLATYGAQVALIKELLEKPDYRRVRNVRVSTVDNFQGEENKIILLSLVRSNKNESVGFLSTDNRVCVALSRAQYGMYVIGNMDLLKRHSELWTHMMKTAEQHGYVGPALTLRCRQHGNETLIKKAEDFKNVFTRGCGKACRAQLKCGHVCKYFCHAAPHENRPCTELCSKVCQRGHICAKHKCYQKPCPPCRVKTTLRCGHTVSHRCIEVPSVCSETLVKLCVRGHKCETLCGKPPKCMQMMTQKLECGHIVEFKCYQQPACSKCEIKNFANLRLVP